MRYKAFLILFTYLLYCTTLLPVAEAGDLVQVPAFKISNLAGTRFSSRKNLDHPLVLSFFFTRCPPCIKEMPQLYKFMKQEKRLDQLLFIDAYVNALKVKESPDNKRKIMKFIKRLHIPKQNVYFDEIGIFLKKLGRLKIFPKANKYRTIVIYPTILVIKKGELVLSIEGSEPDFLERIRQML